MVSLSSDEHATKVLASAKHHPPSAFALIASSLPFLITFILVAALAWRNLYPLLSGQSSDQADRFSYNNRSQPPNRSRSCLARLWRRIARRTPALTFSVTTGLSAVLAELIFCEVSNILNPAARRAALEITISILLVSLVIITPAIEIHSISTAATWRFTGLGVRARFLTWLLDVIGLCSWLLGFWWMGRFVLSSHSLRDLRDRHGLSEGSLERIGIIGISLMASLAGFAAVSSLWQTFGVRDVHVSQTDLARKQTALDATTDLVVSKQTRLQTLERKLAGKTPQGFVTRMIGTIRGDVETLELSALRLEISGLETMQLSLSNNLRLLKARHEAQAQANTAFGRAMIVASYVFSIYCLYRIAATSATTMQRWWRPATSFATTDPINNVLALVAKHLDPTIDREAWSRQISFLLSGLMLLASFNAVLQTVVLFSRFTPARLLQSAQQNLALLVSQITATYVVSSALLLRSNLPKEMGSVIEGALGAPLDSAFVDRWFENWFLGACVITAAGILAGRKIAGVRDWEQDLESGESGAELETKFR